MFDNSADNPNNPNDPPQAVSWGERTVDEMALAFVAVSLRYPGEVLGLFVLAGRDLPHELGLRPLRASSPPEIRSAKIDKKGRLVVRVKRCKGGGRLEVDGVPLQDSLVLARNSRRIRVDAGEAFGEATSAELRVRRADGRLSDPYEFDR